VPRASSQTRIAHGERLYGHVEEGCTNHALLDLSVHVRPARSIFSNALNFCCSAIAVLVRSPCRYCPFRLPGGPPLPLAPPCIDNAQLRADETRLRAKVRGDVFERLLKTIAEEKAKMAKQEAAQAPRLDVSHGEDADGEAAN